MNNLLTKKIMRRVYALWCLRQLFSSLAVKIYIVFILGLIIKAQVSIIDVWGNAARADYFLYAFTHTDRVVQVAVLGVLVLSLWFVYDFLRNLYPRQQSYR